MTTLTERLDEARHLAGLVRAAADALGAGPNGDGGTPNIRRLVAAAVRAADLLWRLDDDHYADQAGSTGSPAATADGFDAALRQWLDAARAVADRAATCAAEGERIGGLDALLEHIDDAEGVLLSNGQFFDAGDGQDYRGVGRKPTVGLGVLLRR